MVTAIAGGEPFSYPSMIDICSSFPDSLFLIFTKGTVIGKDNHKALMEKLALLTPFEWSCSLYECVIIFPWYSLLCFTHMQMH